MEPTRIELTMPKKKPLALCRVLPRSRAEMGRSEATCDAQGRFAFNGIAPGAYVVFTGVTWVAGDERQGGPMEQGVTVSPGENNVILSQ